jgi:hypothetical protein
VVVVALDGGLQLGSLAELDGVEQLTVHGDVLDVKDRR